MDLMTDFKLRPDRPGKKVDIELPKSSPFDSSLTVVSREDWGAEPAAYVTPLPWLASFVRFVHTENMDPCSTREECISEVRALQMRDKQDGFPDINFSFLVGENGTVYVGRGWKLDHELPDDFREVQGKCITIAYMGHYKCKMVDRDKLYSLYLREKKDGGPSVDIVSREEWGARSPLPSMPRETDPRLLKIPMDHVTFTHTSTETCHSYEECCHVIRRIQREHIEVIKIHDMTFNFLISSDGVVYEGRGWYKEPHRPMLYEYLENRGIEVAYIGEFEDIPPTPPMLRAAFDLILYGMKVNLISPNHQCIHLA